MLVVMSDGFPGDLTMNNELPADKKRDDIEDLRSDIQEFMENSTPRQKCESPNFR
jgi:hypothetical protein